MMLSVSRFLGSNQPRRATRQIIRPLQFGIITPDDREKIKDPTHGRRLLSQNIQQVQQHAQASLADDLKALQATLLVIPGIQDTFDQYRTQLLEASETLGEKLTELGERLPDEEVAITTERDAIEGKRLKRPKSKQRARSLTDALSYLQVAGNSDNLSGLSFHFNQLMTYAKYCSSDFKNLLQDTITLLSSARQLERDYRAHRTQLEIADKKLVQLILRQKSAEGFKQVAQIIADDPNYTASSAVVDALALVKTMILGVNTMGRALVVRELDEPLSNARAQILKDQVSAAGGARQAGQIRL